MFTKFTQKTFVTIIVVPLIFISFFFFNTCSDTGTSTEPRSPLPCDEAKLVLSRLTTIVIPPPPEIGGDSITCPQFIYGPRPFHLGDTLAVIVSQAFGAQVIGSNPVYVNIKSKFGDSETYWLKGGAWPCESNAVDVAIYRAIIFYNTTDLGGPPYPFPNNGQLEIRSTGDTIVASFHSFCSGNILTDTVAVLPR